MRFTIANVLVCLWTAVTGCLFLIQPFLPEPAKTYAGHAMYLAFFVPIGALMIAYKIRTGSFPSFKPVDSPTKSLQADISAASVWIAAFLIAGVGTGSVLKYSGCVNDRRILLFAMLCAPIVVIAAYYAYRYARQIKSCRKRENISGAMSTTVDCISFCGFSLFPGELHFYNGVCHPKPRISGCRTILARSFPAAPILPFYLHSLLFGLLWFALAFSNLAGPRS